jgi:hypothetical protein
MPGLHAPASYTACVPLARDDRRGIRVAPVVALAPAERGAMRELLAEYYAGVSAARFDADLDEKQWVVQGVRPDGVLWGFSTLMALQATVDGEPLLAFYSGDTVVRREHWGRESTAMVGLALRHMHAVAEATPGRRAYWFVISSTYRSYGLLSQLFRDYGPAAERPLSSRERRIVAELSRLKGFTEYDAARSVVRFANPTRFRDAAATGEAAARSAAARFFAESNPGAADGDRLASLAELCPENLSALGRRLVAGSLRGELASPDPVLDGAA